MFQLMETNSDESTGLVGSCCSDTNVGGSALEIVDSVGAASGEILWSTNAPTFAGLSESCSLKNPKNQITDQLKEKNLPLRK